MQNFTPTNSDNLVFSVTPVSVGGSVSGTTTVAAGVTSGSISGLSFTGSTTGASQTGTFTVNDANATNSGAIGTVTVNVLDHASPGLSDASVSVNLLKGATASVSTTLSNDSGYRAGLQIGVVTSGLTYSGTSLIAQGDNRVLSAVVVNSSYDPAYYQVYTIGLSDGALPGATTLDEQDLHGQRHRRLRHGQQGECEYHVRHGLDRRRRRHGQCLRRPRIDGKRQRRGTDGAAMVGSVAKLLYGTPSEAKTAVSMAWRTRTVTEASNPLLISDVVNLTGMGPGGGEGQTDKFVLQMSYDPTLLIGGSEADMAAAGGIYLATFDAGTQTWKNAILGNHGDNSGGTANVQGVWNSTDDTALGTWGVDAADHVVWAVVDHNSQFAVIPEPGTLALLAAGLLGLLAYAWRKRK